MHLITDSGMGSIPKSSTKVNGAVFDGLATHIDLALKISSRTLAMTAATRARSGIRK
jgi:hypothetical protein